VAVPPMTTTPRELSRDFIAMWEAHVERERARADAQIARQIVEGKRSLRTYRTSKPVVRDGDSAVLLPFDQYDVIIVSFSGGKDSLACLLHLFDLGVPPEKIELWHQSVDGEPGVAKRFFDWPCTESYCLAVADALGVRLLFQWLHGGYEGELTKRNAATQKMSFEMPDGTVGQAGGGGDVTTRLEFPKVGSIDGGRWCSAYLKIDVAKKTYTNDPRFAGARTLVISGERAEESSNRAKYPTVKRHGFSVTGVAPDATDDERVAAQQEQARLARERPWPAWNWNTKQRQKRDITEWRPILDWREPHVWEIISRYSIRPHPAYGAGFSRVSCMPCIFGNSDQWATVNELDPELMVKIAGYEKEFDRRKPGPNAPFKADPKRHGMIQGGGNVLELAARGVSYLQENVPADDLAYARASAHLAMLESYPADLIIDRGWRLPRGAGRKSIGPT